MKPHRLVVVGNGVSAWVTMAALAHAYPQSLVEIIHVDPGQVAEEPAVADSCLASVRRFHAQLRISERELMHKTQATFKLGVCYQDWVRKGSRFFHALGEYGNMLDGIDFHQYATLLHQCGDVTPFDAYSLAAHAVTAEKFGFLGKELSEKGLRLDYTLHVDLTQYSALMKEIAHKKSVKTIQGNIESLRCDNKTEAINALVLSSGETVEGDQFFDCSGASNALMRHLENQNFIDWSDSFPINKKIDFIEDTPPSSSLCTLLRPHAHGWVRSIPLRHKTLHSWFYNNNYITDADALNAAHTALEVPSEAGLLADVKPGRKKQFWVTNCVAIGASAANFTDITLSYLHHVQNGILRFIELYSMSGANVFAAAEYNNLTACEYERVLDYQRLNLLLCTSQSSEFWDDLKSKSCSADLAHKLKLFKRCGKLAFHEYETWLPSAWISLLLGLDFWPQQHDLMLNGEALDAVVKRLAHVKSTYSNIAQQMPRTEDFLSRYTNLS